MDGDEELYECPRCHGDLVMTGPKSAAHVDAAQGLVCNLLFGGGSMLDALMSEED